VAADPRLRADLAKKLNVSERRLYQLAADMKSEHGPMGTDDAIYVIAQMNRLDLTKYIDDREVVDRIRGMIPRGAVARPATTPAQPTTAKTRTQVTRAIRVGSTAAAAELLLPKAFEDDAERMSNLYPKMYLLENSIRSVIVRVLAAKYGKDWWALCAPTDVRNKVKDRKAKEAKEPWHGQRGSHEIYYSDFGDLRKIIESKWGDFSPILPSRPWITQKLEELEPARNILAHHNPVPANEQKRLELYYDDWAAMIKDRGGAIPA
jgi:hypothetical protein